MFSLALASSLGTSVLETRDDSSAANFSSLRTAAMRSSTCEAAAAGGAEGGCTALPAAGSRGAGSLFVSSYSSVMCVRSAAALRRAFEFWRNPTTSWATTWAQRDRTLRRYGVAGT